jgi:stage V sporulation protein G
VPEVVATEELKLDLIRVVCDPNPLFKYQLIYRDGNATGMVGVYSYDEDWYYLYKEDNDRYKVKRRKDLEGIEPAFTYKQRKRRIDQPDNQKTLNSKKAKVAIEVVTENTAAQALDMNRNQALTQDNPSSELPEQTSGMQMGGM